MLGIEGVFFFFPGDLPKHVKQFYGGVGIPNFQKLPKSFPDEPYNQCRITMEVIHGNLWSKAALGQHGDS